MLSDIPSSLHDKLRCLQANPNPQQPFTTVRLFAKAWEPNLKYLWVYKKGIQVLSSFHTQLQFILPRTIPLPFALPTKMTSLNRKLVAGDQFRFSSNSLPAVKQGEDYGLAFGEWTGWHGDNYHVSGHHDEPDRLAKLDSKSPVNQLLSPASRVEAIARYKKEMLELVKDAPEYAYELSLRDLVELPRIVRTARDLVELPKIVRAVREPPARERLQKNNSRRGGQEKVKKAGRRHLRSESMESGGFLLKMFFPIPSSGTKRSSRSSSGSLKPSSHSSSSGSLKPSSRSSSSGSSESGSSSSSSNSNSASSSSGTSKSGSNSRVSSKPLMKDARKPGAHKSSEWKCVEMQQHGALSRNCSRYHLVIGNNYPYSFSLYFSSSRHQSGCYPFFLNQKKKNRTKRI